jgi:hypothetical protein
MFKTKTEKLREAAIANGLGGNTKERVALKDHELISMVEKFRSQNHLYYSPLNEREYDSHTAWMGHLSHYWDTSTVCSFKLHLHPVSCKHCEIQITPANWFIGSDKKVSLYCASCVESGSWRTTSHRVKHNIQTGSAISEAKIAFYQTARGEEVKQSIGQKNRGHRNVFYASEEGNAYKLSYGEHMSKVMSQKVLSGEFTPNIKNSRTNWEASVVDTNGNKRNFRSSWEACVWLSNNSWTYEKIRIPYKVNNVIKIYLVDFVDEKTKTLYEVKPIAFLDKFNIKKCAADKWCAENGYSFMILTEQNIMDHVDITKFSDNNMQQLDRLRRSINAYSRHQIDKET